MHLAWLGGKNSVDEKQEHQFEPRDASKLRDQINLEAAQLESAIARFDT